LRHTFNTYMRKAGVPESVIMEITGHSTREMFDRYNTVDAEDAKQAVDQLQNFLKSVDQNVDHAPLENKKGLTLTQLTLCNCYGAEGGTRTRTSVSLLDPEYSSIVTPGNMK